MPSIFRRPLPLRVYISRSALSGALAWAVIVVSPVTAADPPPPTFVQFHGRTVALAGPVTVEGVLNRTKVWPKTGRMLSMRGAVLDASAFPPTFTVDGRVVSASEKVRSWETLEVQDGADVAEATVVETTLRPAANPQFYVGSGTVTTRRGLTSGEVEVVSSEPGSGPPLVALTFDDGPDTRYTPQILDVLAQARVPATFFVLGKQAKRYPDLLRREVSQGMFIGDHTWDHSVLKGKPVNFITDQLTRTRNELAGLGVTPGIFRPPYGSFDATTVNISSSLGMRTVIWSIDTFDWKKPGVPVIVARVLSSVRPGSVILMHDGGGDRTQTVEALRILIAELRARGYSFVTV